MYSLSNAGERSNTIADIALIPKTAAFIVYTLATKTTILGKRFDKNWSDLYANETVVFLAYLLTKNIGIFSSNAFNVLNVRKYFAAKNKTFTYNIQILFTNLNIFFIFLVVSS